MNIHDLITWGRTLSTVSTSFEKRFKTRPIGVVSNNSIGQRKTNLNKTLCISLAEYRKPNAIINDAMKFEKTIKITEKKLY